jgi:hypothetical protein
MAENFNGLACRSVLADANDDLSSAPEGPGQALADRGGLTPIVLPIS